MEKYFKKQKFDYVKESYDNLLGSRYGEYIIKNKKNQSADFSIMFHDRGKWREECFTKKEINDLVDKKLEKYYEGIDDRGVYNTEGTFREWEEISNWINK